MRCPKCHYLSFEPELRCRNCGYDLSIADADLPLHAPAADVRVPKVGPRAARASVDVPPSITLGPIHRGAEEEPEPGIDRPFTAAAPVETRWASSPLRAGLSSRPSTTAELPLFVLGLTSASPEREEPRLKVPSAHAPLSVRKRTPDQAGMKARYGRSSAVDRPRAPAERDLLESLDRPERAETADLRARIAHAHEPAVIAATAEPAGAATRLAAAVLDGLLLGSINAAVVWLTLRQCGLTLHDAGGLPMVPLVAFLLVIDAGYLLMFTAASGQTLGKMAAGIRVVGSPDVPNPERVTLRQATVRELVALPSILALGAGFVPALIGNHQAFHDRIAHTRVIRA
jgi:uncharacterized RDD family membrane protein YckC